MADDQLDQVARDSLGLTWRDAVFCRSCKVDGPAGTDVQAFIALPHRSLCPVQLLAEQVAAVNQAADLTRQLAEERAARLAAEACADLLVRIVRPMYSGPSGDQGLNDPLYGECLSAIRRYKESKAAALRGAAVRDGGE